MFLLSLGILFSPFAVACAIAGSRRARTFVAKHYWPCLAVGWSAVALLAPVAVALHGASRAAALAIVCPPIALSFWRRGQGDDGGGPDDPEPPRPDGPEIDWDRFQRELDEFVVRTPRDRPRDRVPA